MNHANVTATAPADRVSLPAKLGYGTGAIGSQIFRDTPALILPIYMITVLGIPAWMAGLAILLPKAWIIFWDPLVGSWSDRRRSTWGRAPFLLAGALMSGLTFAMMFTAPDFSSPLASAAYMTLSFALASTAYSLFSVPYLSVAAELSTDARERTRVLSFRICFLAIGVAVGAGYALPLANALGKGWTGFHRMGLIYGLVCMTTMFVTYATVRRIRLIAIEPSDGTTQTSQMKAVFENKPFLVLIFAYFIALSAQAMTYTVLGLYFLYVIGDPGQLAIMNVFAALSVLVAQPATVYLNRYLSKRFLFMAGIVGWSLLAASWITAGQGEVDWIAAHLGITVPLAVTFAIRGFLWGMFNSVYLLMALSLLTDTIALDRKRTGQSHSGLYSGIFSAVEKVGFALGPAISGIILSMGGFVGSKSADVIVQSPQAITTLTLAFCAYPVALKLLSLLIFTRYKEQ